MLEIWLSLRESPHIAHIYTNKSYNDKIHIWSIEICVVQLYTYLNVKTLRAVLYTMYIYTYPENVCTRAILNNHHTQHNIHKANNNYYCKSRPRVHFVVGEH